MTSTGTEEVAAKSDNRSESSQQPQNVVWKGLCAGAVSGLASRFVVYPFDTLKSQLQLQGALAGANVHRGFLNAASNVARADGILGFYRGFSIILAGVIPANMAYFGGYELGKAVVPDGSGLVGNMATGAVAQITAGVVFNPIDILKERMQVQSLMKGTYSYSGARDALRSLLKQDGPAGLLRGYWVTNSVWIPWNIIYIACYEAAKEAAAGEGSTEDLSAWAISGSAACSAAAAALVTSPMDVVKTQVQVLAAAPGGGDITAAQTARRIWAKEGLRGFFSGTAARVLAIAPGSAISWVLYENIKPRL